MYTYSTHAMAQEPYAYMHRARARERESGEKEIQSKYLYVLSIHGQTKQAMYKQFLNTINTRAINYEKQIFYTHTHQKNCGINWPAEEQRIERYSMENGWQN